MISDKINDIIKMLIESTENEDIKWDNVGGQGSPYQNERKLSTKSEDGDSQFELDIKYRLTNDEWILEPSFGLWIKNTNLPNGMMYLMSNNYTDLLKLRELIRIKYCSDMSPSTQAVEDNLHKIFKGISKSNYIEGQLSKIINKDK